ncbi:MAG: type II toxin-antitoxin system prevent-host-death family antitoxin [Acetobacteraceae bacterium]
MSAAVQISVEEADTKLSDLLDRVERGEEITIARDGRPVARLVAAPPAHDAAAARAAVEAIWELREKIRQESGPVTTDEILELIREGRKY